MKENIPCREELRMHIAIVEDEQDQSRQLREYLHTYAKENNLPLEVSCHSSGVDFLKTFQRQYNMILLDISMPMMDGMETAHAIRRLDGDVAILFITNMAQHAIRGYEVEAMDYILKPITYFSFSQRISRAISRIGKNQKQYLMISDRSGTVRLAVDEILYVESRGHNLTYHTLQGDHTFSGTMKDAEEKLAEHHFFRCNKGLLVSLRHVDSVRSGCALIGETELLISRPRKNAFMEALADYIGGTV